MCGVCVQQFHRLYLRVQGKQYYYVCATRFPIMDVYIVNTFHFTPVI